MTNSASSDIIALATTSRRAAGRTTGLVIPLAMLWLILGLSAPRFLTLVNISNLSVQFAVIGILAIGTTSIIISREIDLSIGAVTGACAVISAMVIVKFGMPWPLAVVAAVIAGALVGWINGWLVTKVGIPSFVATLGMLGVVSGGALVISDGQTIYGFPEAYQWLGQGSLLGVRAPMLICLVVLLAMHFVLRQTTTGIGFYAVGSNSKAAELVGISVGRTKTTAFVISGACAGLAGVISSARLDSANPTLGTLDLLDAIAAVVIGGASLMGGSGTILGTAAGVLLIVTIRNGLTLLGVNPFWQQTVVGLIIVLAAVLGKFNERQQQ
jgi:ribose transport system permease protein